MGQEYENSESYPLLLLIFPFILYMFELYFGAKKSRNEVCPKVSATIMISLICFGCMLKWEFNLELFYFSMTMGIGAFFSAMGDLFLAKRHYFEIGIEIADEAQLQKKKDSWFIYGLLSFLIGYYTYGIALLIIGFYFFKNTF